MAAEWDGEVAADITVGIGATRPVVLGGLDTVWLVTGAPVEVFAADPGDRSPWQFLGTLGPGALLAGSSRTARHVLTGRPQEGCTLRRLSVTDLTSGARHPALGHHPIADGVDATLAALHQVIPAADEPATAVVLGAAVTELRAGEIARCSDGVHWVTIEEGRVRPARVGGHRDREAGEVVVVINGDGIRAVTDCRIAACRTDDMLGSGRLWKHLGRHQEDYLRAVDEWLDALSTEQDHRMSASTAMMADMVARADERLRDVALPGTGTSAPPPDAGAAHAARVACALVARATGSELGPATALSADGIGDPVLQVARAARLPARPVTLPDRWWRHDMGPLVGYLGPGRRPVALLRTRFGYLADDEASGRRPVTRALASQLQPDAVMFYRRLPDKPIGGWRLTWFALRGTRPDQLRLFLGGLLAFLLGLGVPVLSGQILGEFVPQGRADLLVEACVAVLVASVVGASFSVLSSVALLRLEGRLDATLQAAVWYRLLQLPLVFHRRFSTGELANAAMGISTIRTVLSGIASTVFSSSMMAAANFGLMFWYSPTLGAFAVGLVAVHTAVFITIRVRLVAAQKKLVDLEYKLSNQVFQTLRGLPKLRVAAAEGFAYASWATSFARNQALALRFKRSQSIVVALDVIYVPSGALLLYVLLAGPAEGALTIAGFITFMAAFTAVLSSMAQVTTAVATGGIVGPIFDRVKPVLNELPEVAVRTTVPIRLSGDIDLTEVSFRYEPDAPLVLRDVSLRIRAGEFVAVVGPTGCGKSTLLRLLIGFNQPTTGSIRYDGVGLAQLDVAEVRRQCGIVLQQSMPFAGTVLRNIFGPGSYTADEAWEAARMAGLEEDLRRMPLGLETLLSDGGPELSGGQRQRLMIAQALIRRPRILFFDEATSALDNATQSVVAESTRSLSATRLVIAHRLSTIMNADRVVVMDEGHIVESGSPAELLADERGMFAQLVARQRL